MCCRVKLPILFSLLPFILSWPTQLCPVQQKKWQDLSISSGVSLELISVFTGVGKCIFVLQGHESLWENK